MFIGEVAKKAGVNVETIRFYERRGLVPQPTRREGSGYREYSDEAVSRIRFIRRARELGFTLKEIKEILNLRESPTTTCGELKVRVEQKLADVEARLRDLKQIKMALRKLADECAGGKAPASECPILQALKQTDFHPSAMALTKSKNL